MANRWNERNRKTKRKCECTVELRSKLRKTKQTNIKRDGKPNKVVCQNVRKNRRGREKKWWEKRGDKEREQAIVKTETAKQENEKGNDLKVSVKPLRIDRHMYLCPQYSQFCHSFIYFWFLVWKQRKYEQKSVRMLCIAPKKKANFLLLLQPALTKPCEPTREKK